MHHPIQSISRLLPVVLLVPLSHCAAIVYGADDYVVCDVNDDGEFDCDAAPLDQRECEAIAEDEGRLCIQALTAFGEDEATALDANRSGPGDRNRSDRTDRPGHSNPTGPNERGQDERRDSGDPADRDRSPGGGRNADRGGSPDDRRAETRECQGERRFGNPACIPQ